MHVLKTLALFSLAAALLAAPAAAQPDDAPENVIFLVADGMGISQVTLGRLAAKRLGQSYAFDRFKSIGLASTSSFDSMVTDSAAAGTALATGVKTRNQTIGQDDQQRPLETIFDVAHRTGWATGLVTTTRITHATPAAFTAHVYHRSQEAEVARQQASKGYPEVMLGGGARMFGDSERDLMRSHGFQVMNDMAAIAEVKSGKLLGLVASSHLPYRIDHDEGQPTLRDLTAKAVEILESHQKRFLLVVESGRIDHAGHDHDAAALVHEQLAFSETLNWVLDYQLAHPRTLIVVTSDHATGSLGVTEATQLIRLIHSRSSAEAIMKRARANGRDTYSDVLPGEVLKAYAEVEFEDWEVDEVLAHDDKYWEVMALGHRVSTHLGVSWYDPDWQHENLKNTHGHDGGMVGVYAAGPGAERFAGLYENTEIPLRISEVAGLQRPGSVLSRE